jgi:hypothetical protein
VGLLSTVLLDVYVEVRCSSNGVNLNKESQVHAVLWLYLR